MQTVTNKELEEMAQDLYKRLGGVGQKDARIVRALLARITELETAGRELNSLLNSTMSWRQEEVIQVPFVMSLMIGSLGKKSEKFSALLKG